MGRKKIFVKDIQEAGRYNVTKKEDHYAVSKMSGVTGLRVKTDPLFSNTLANSALFKICAQTAKLLRTALQPLFTDVTDAKLNSKLIQFIYILKSNALHKNALPCYFNLSEVHLYELLPLRIQHLKATDFRWLFRSIKRKSNLIIKLFRVRYSIKPTTYKV